jgi:hemerythrin
MKFVEWNDSYSVDNVLLDAHHQTFFLMVRQFGESTDMDGYEAVKKRVAFLVEYVAMHLNAEERLMRETAYPDLEQHKAIHDAFTRKVLAIRESFLASKEPFAADEVLQTMQDWFLNHILTEDRKYIPFLKQGA